MVALERAGIQVDAYYASEIEPYAIKISQKNYPNIIQLGDITKITEEMLDSIMPIDLVIGGSPCQDLSVYKFDRGEVTGLNGEKSGLFYHYVRILQYVKPKFFLLENVPMEERWKNQISDLLGVEPVMINSNLVCAADRKRLYWTNIPGITQPQNKGIMLKDIVIPGCEVPDKYWYSKPFIFNGNDCKVQCTLEMKGHRHMKEVYNLNGKCSTLTTCNGGNLQKKVYQDERCRKLTPLEYERLQNLPDGYTEGVADTHRYSAIGNGWTVDVIAHIFSSLPDEYKQRKEQKEMELKILNPTEDGFLKAIEWNHEEIKKEVSEKIEHYKNLVYTDEQIKDAKSDRATLNKFVKALEDKRKEIKKQCLAPYEDFEKKMKEIVAIVNEPIGLIDTQLKEYEEKRKREKATKVDEILKEAEKSLPDDMHIPFDSKWLNSSVSMKSIKEAIDGKIEQVKNDLDTLSNLPEFGFEAVEVYKTTLDINKAVNEAKRMSEIAKAKAEHEVVMKAKAEEQKQEEFIPPTANDEPFEQNMNPPVVEATDEPKRDWISFKALLSVDEAKDLKWFFETKGIKFEAI